jgi:putative aldouronate transport system substrate-binding protein
MQCRPNTLVAMVEAGLLEDLDDFYWWLDPRVRGLYAMEREYMDAATVDGVLRSLPVAVDKPVCLFLYLRADWLKRLRLGSPKSVKDVEDAGRAFMFGDPDGNAKSDTIGFPLDSDIGTAEGYCSGYGSYPFGNSWITGANGSVYYGAVSERTKAALSALSSLRKEGVIDPEFAVTTFSTINEDIAAGRVGLLYGGRASPIGALLSCIENDRNAEWLAIHIPDQSGGIAPSMNYIVPENFRAVRRDFRYPSALMKMGSLDFDLVQ